MPYYVPRNNPNAAFRPFSPRVVDVRYRAWPAGPKVYLPAPDAGSGQNQDFCGSDYPYDPRDLSLSGVYWNGPAAYTFTCPNGSITITMMEFTFYSTVSQFEADNLACEAAAAEAVRLGYTCATCNIGIMQFADGEHMTFASGEPMTFA